MFVFPAGSKAPAPARRFPAPDLAPAMLPKKPALRPSAASTPWLRDGLSCLLCVIGTQTEKGRVAKDSPLSDSRLR